MNQIAIFSVILAFLVIPIIVTTTYATEEDYSNDPEYQGKTPLRFYQIFASKDVWYAGACDDAKNSLLRSKTIQVLKMYDYLPITSKMECVKVTGSIEIDKNKWVEDSTYGLTLEQTINRAKNWNYDLLIIILDDTFSAQFLTESFKAYPHGASGHIVYDAKTIVSTTYSDGTEQPEATRIMAHEIAHFAVQKKYGWILASGTEKTIAEKAVHDVDRWFDDCRLYGSLEKCSYLWVPLETHYGDSIAVMSPNYVMNIAESMKPKVIAPITNTNKGNPDTINGLVVEYGNLKQSILNYKTSKIYEYQQLHFESPLAKAKLGYVLNVLNGINFESNDYNVAIHTKNWMKGLYSVGETGMHKEIASLNQEFSKIRNLDSEIITAKNLENDFKDKLEKPETVYFVDVKINTVVANSDKILAYADPREYYVTNDQPLFTLYVETPQGWKQIKSVIGQVISNWQEGNFGTANSYSNGKYKIDFNYKNSKTNTSQKGTAYFEINNSPKTQSFPTQNKENDQKDLESKTQNLISKSDLSWLLSKRNDTKKRLADIEDEFNQSFESLKQSEKDFIEEIPKEHISKGWDIRLKLLREFPELQGLGGGIIQNMDILEYEQNEGNVHSISISEIKRDVGFFESKADKMISDMKYISQEIEYAKKAHEESSPKTCFLFWCW